MPHTQDITDSVHCVEVQTVYTVHCVEVQTGTNRYQAIETTPVARRTEACCRALWPSSAGSLARSSSIPASCAGGTHLLSSSLLSNRYLHRRAAENRDLHTTLEA